MPIALPPPHLLEVTGADAAAFAHAQFASDVRGLAVGHWQWSAWLSAQGRVRASFRLLRTADERLLALWWGVAAGPLRDALARYVLRSRVRLQVLAAEAAAGYFDAHELPTGFAPPSADAYLADARVTLLPVAGAAPRWLAVGDAAALGPLDPSDEARARWRSADIEAGIVELGDEQSDRYLPAWLALERLGAVRVDKGCYPGQEIVARMHFRGGNKRWLHRLAFRSAELPRPGQALHDEHGTHQGDLVAAAWTRAPDGVALAVLPALPAQAALRAPGAAASFRVICAVGDASA